VPDTLKEKYRIFESYGRVFRDNDELFNDTSWYAVMVGQGLTAEGHDPVADLLPLDETRRRLAQIREVMRNSADRMPSHAAFIADHCAA